MPPCSFGLQDARGAAQARKAAGGAQTPLQTMLQRPLQASEASVAAQLCTRRSLLCFALLRCSSLTDVQVTKQSPTKFLQGSLSNDDVQVDDSVGFLRQRIQEFNACIPYAGRLGLSSVLRAWQHEGWAAITLFARNRKGGAL